MSKTATRKKAEKKRGRGRPAIGKPRSIRASDQEWEAWRAAAEREGVEFASWIRQRLNGVA